MILVFLLCLLSVCQNTEAAQSPVTVLGLQIKLVGGSKTGEGRVEIRLDDSHSWGTICDDYWGEADATVVCRMFGYQFGAARRYASFGQGSGPIYMDNVQCRGNEPVLTNCSYSGWETHNCRHYEDAGVSCFNQAVRLVAMSGNDVGAVQMREMDGWKSVCDSQWDDNAATVVCKQLQQGFTYGTALCCSKLSPYTWDYQYRNGVSFTNFTCTGNERYLNNCSYVRQNRVCPRRHRASVACYSSQPSSADLRFSLSLFNGSSSGQSPMWGMLKIRYKGKDGVSCAGSFNDTAANVACKQLGRAGGMKYGSSTWRAPLPSWITRYSCSGSETSLDSCVLEPWGEPVYYCRPNSVLCYDSQPPTINLVGSGPRSGRVEITFNGQKGTICDNSWTNNDAKVVCKTMGFVDGYAMRGSYYGRGTGSIYMDRLYCNGREDNIFACPNKGWGIADSSCIDHSKDASVVCYNEVRLVRGDHAHGIVQVKNTRYRYTYWTPLCGTGFGDNEAKVVCKEMGFDNGKSLPLGAYGRYYSWRGYVRKNITCTGSETSILNCTYASSTCTTNGQTNYASVACYNGTLDDTTSITLEGGAPGYTSKSGRVVVTKHGVKGRVCGQYWEDIDATIVCKQLSGSNRGGVAYQFAQVSNGPFWLSELGCFGNETSLFQCPVGPEGCSSNSYYKDAGVLCYSSRRAPYLSIVGGGNKGRVKINYDSQSGYICADRYFYTSTAKVICRQLGFFDGVSDRATVTGGTAFMDSPYCRGYETSVFQCTNSGWRSKSTCGKQAQVICYKHVRLTKGAISSTSARGQVQLFAQNQWKTVCGDMFDDKEARVACRELGFSYGKALSPGAFGSQYVYWRWRLNTVGGFNCTGFEPSLANCSFNAAPYNCRRDYPFSNYASLSCSNTRFSTGFTVSLDENFPSDVKINMYGIDGTICSDFWGDEEASVVCRQMGYQSGIAIGPERYYNYHYYGKARLLAAFNCTGNENRLQDCPYSTDIPSSCTTPGTTSKARVYCFDTQHDISLSLINGPTGNQGIVQVTIDNKPGTICGGLSSRSAKVICKQLGYLDGTSQSSSLYGNTTGFSYLYQPSCDGSEGKIWNCKNNGWNVTYSTCSGHRYDARVKCTGYVRLRPNAQFGAVQLYDPNARRYGLVCADNFTDVDANVACAEVGYEYGISVCCSAFGYQYYSLAYAQMSCNGREPSLINCTYETSLTYCPSRKYASVACSNIAPNSGYNLQIGTSDTNNYGRVRVSHMGIWGYICPDGFDNNDANVICKMKDFAGGFSYVYRYDYSNSMRWLSNIQCSGTESSLSRCKGMVWGAISSCQSRRNAGVYCYRTSGLQVRLNGTKRGYGRVEVAIDGVWGRMCRYSSYSSYNTANVACRHLGFTGGTSVGYGSPGSGPIYIRSIYCSGTESSINECSLNWGTTRYCTDLNVQCYGRVRLNGFYHLPNYGRVEMKLTDRWIPVCDDQFTDTAAKVVCKNLGYVDGKKQCCSAIGYIYGNGNRANITINRCSGNEESLTECQYSPGICSSGKYVTVLCSNTVLQPTSIQLRLTSTSLPYRGVVDAKKYGFYGPICGSGWTDANANVTCKQLGFLGGIAEKISSYSYSSQPIVLGGYNCTGQENNLDNCPSLAFDADKGCETSQYYRQKAAVLCYNSGGISLGIVNGTTSNAGRVQLTYGSISGRVCISYDSNTIATVACKQMGFKGGFADRTTYTADSSLRRQTTWLSGLRCYGRESNLLQCSHNWKPRTSYYYYRCRDLGVVCYNDIRLTNGNHLSTGSIEININNNWGSVCDHNWKPENTRVACKQMGFDDGVTACCSAYGNHPKAIIENVQCTGTESRLQDCTHDNPHSRSCYKHNVAVVCYKGTKPTSYTWRLGGGNNYTGEVLVDYMGTTGRICSDGWDDKDAMVVCKNLGFRNGTAYNHARFDYYYATHGPFWLSNVACTGSESTLNDCPLSTPLAGVSSCTSGKAAGVLCTDISGIYYRINGPQDNIGRVEVSVNGIWGSICDYGFNNQEANVFCKTLGYSDGRAQVVSYPNPSGPVYSSYFQCTGDESSLAACPHQGWHKATDRYCSGHRRDASVICYDQVRLATGFGPDIKQGPVQYYNNGTWNLVCDTDFNDLSAKRLCQDIGFFDGKAICCSAYGIGFQFWYNGGYRISNMTMACTGDEKSAMDCLQPTTCESQNYASAICFNDTDVINEDYTFKFHDTSDTSGRVEVMHYNTKGRICSRFWDDANARVYCKKRGYPDGIAYHSSRWTWTSITERGPFWVGAMNCTGSEASLNNCSFTNRLNLGNCSQADVGAAACFNDTTGIKYRLVGGNDKKEGRVEISVGGVWGTVCDLFWDNREAGVLCRQLGYSDGYAVRGAHYGQGSGPIWLSKIRCDGSESELHKCPHDGFNSEIVDGTYYSWRKCKSHDDDASVVCVDKLKLNLGLNASMGAVEVYGGSGWLGVCDDSFDDNAAAVVCRTMGYPNGVKVPGSSFGITDGPIGIGKIKCTAVMKTFSQCDQVHTRTCPSGLYASVYCSMDDIVDDGIKVVLDPDTSSGQSGLVKVHKGGIWGSVCAAGIDNAFASVACRQFGFGGGIPYTPREDDSGPILMSDIKCNGGESSIKDCSYTDKSKNWCDYYAPRAGVLCYNTSLQFRLTGDPDKSRGRIEMNVDGQWGAFCNPWTDSRVGKVVCKQQGFVDGIMVSGNKYVSPDDEPMWFTYTHCLGNESSITTCYTDGFQFQSYYRRSYEWSCRRRTGPVSVQCYNTEFKISKLRLAGGTNSSGRVEVYLDGPNQWGTVCDDYWSDIDATVVCNQLGFATGKAVKRAEIFGQGTGPIWLDNVACSGSEMNIKDCPSNGYSVHNCQHTEDSGVICKGVYVPPTTSTMAPVVTTSSKGTPEKEKVTGGSDPGKAAAIAVPIVVILIVGAVVGFLYYKRYGNRFKDLREDLVDEEPKHSTGGVSLRSTGAFFSKLRGGGSSSYSSQPGVTNPSYDFAQPSTFSPESDS